MSREEAIEWINGKRSMTNIIPQEPLETWGVRIAQADAAMTQQAYWVLKALDEGVVTDAEEGNPSLVAVRRERPLDQCGTKPKMLTKF